jgi:hypothetical protein
MAIAAVFGLVSSFERMLELAVEAERLFADADGDSDEQRASA